MNKKYKNRKDIVKNIKSKYLVIKPNEKEIYLNLNSKNQNPKEILKKIKNQDLKNYIQSNELNLSSKKEPPSIKIMQEKELVGYVPSSDSGHFQLFPKGKILFDCIKKWCDNIAINNLNCLQIDSPIIYNWSDPEIYNQAKSFHERHYKVKIPNNSKKEFILRFAGDFGLFKMLKSANISYKHLPLRIYEFSKSFRYEQKGELSGLKRLRAFHMPDIHSFSENINLAKKEFYLLHKQYSKLLNSLKIDYSVVFRVVQKYYKEYKPIIKKISKHLNKPVFVELLSKMKHYWAIKNEYQAIDSIKGNLQLSTIQLDIKDSKIYGLNYINKNGKKKGYIICHSSIGSIERLMYSILECSLKRKNPILPLWCSPVHLRVIPISKKHIKFCKDLKFNKKIRWDIDDQDQRLSKKILNARKQWIPYVLIIGDKEINSKIFSVNRRKDSKKLDLKRKDLEKEILDQIKDYPNISLYLPKQLSKRPVFYS